MDRRSFLKTAGGFSSLALMGHAAEAQVRRGFNTVVIGGGVFGMWSAVMLQAMGQRVAVVDAVAPAHSRASSGGESRVTRSGYGDADHYAAWAYESLMEWRALSDRARLPLFHPLGVLWIHTPGDPEVTASAASLERLGIPHERLDSAALGARYPVISLAPGDEALLEPISGGLMARRAVQTLAARFVSEGGTLLTGTVSPVFATDANRGALDSIEVSGLGRVRADSFLFACGPWLDKVCPDAMADRLRPTRQEVYYFAANVRDTGALPVWADLPYYGFPDLEGRGFKVANDTLGETVDPDTQSRRASAEGEAEARDFLARRFPTLANRPLTESRVCQYENTPDRDLVLDQHPGLDNVWIAGGGSGHGFKHGPAVGRFMAGLITGTAQPIARYGLNDTRFF